MSNARTAYDIAQQIALGAVASTKVKRQSRENKEFDPIDFVRYRLGLDPWDKQEEIIRSVFYGDKLRTTVRSGHGVGKTFIAGVTSISYFATYPDSIVVTTAPNRRQVETLLWGHIRSLHKQSGVGGELLRKEIRVTDSHYMIGYTAKDPEGFQGVHSPRLLIVVDEASGLPPQIEKAIDGMMSTENARLLMIGNPTRRSGTFFESFHSKRGMYNKIHISCLDSPNVANPGSRPYLTSPTWIEEREREWGGKDSPLYQVGVMGEFPGYDEYGIVSIDWLDAAEAEDYSDLDREERYVAALDVARYGADKNVLYVRRGRQIIAVREWYGIETMQTVGKVQEALFDIITQEESDPGLNVRDAMDALIVDATGVGGGPADRLRELDWPVEDFVAGESASEPQKYHNRRSEAYWHLRAILQSGDVGGLTDIQTQSQLTSLTYKMQSDQRILIEPKDSLRKRGLKSPDHADALAMCFQDPGMSARIVWIR